MEKIKLSIIVPVYNAENYLKNCVDSLINQSLKDIEIILVDDGSKDSSAMICDEYAQKDNRIKVIHKDNSGAGLSRNEGLKIATGDYIGFVDSDDYVDKKMYEILYNNALNNNYDIVVCGSNQVYADKIIKNELVEKKAFNKTEIIDISIPFICGAYDGKVLNGAIALWHSIYKRDLINMNKLEICSEREYLSEDTLFNLESFCKANNVLFIDEYLYYQCIVDNSLSRKKGTFKIENIAKFYNKGKDIINANKLPNEEICIKYLKKRCLNEYKSKIAKELRFSNNNEAKTNFLQLCNEPLMEEIARTDLKDILSFNERLFQYLIKKKLYFITRILFKIKK